MPKREAPGGFQRLNALGAPEQSEFAVMPAFNVQLGRQVSEHARIFAGYSFSYLSRVARLGDVLDPTSTGLTFTDFWVQSISFGPSCGSEVGEAAGNRCCTMQTEKSGRPSCVLRASRI